MIPKPFKRGRIYYYQFRLAGKRFFASTRETTVGRAQQVTQDAYEAALRRSRGEQPEPTLGALADLWIQRHTLIFSPARLRTMENIARLHLGTLAQLKLRDLTTPRVEEARLRYLQNHARESANTWLFALGTLLHWAIKQRMIREMPFRVAALKVQRKPKVLLPTAKAAVWMAAIAAFSVDDPGLGLAIRICIGLGLRISEALDARWEWLDFERRTYTPGQTKGREAWPRPVPGWLLDQLRPAAVLVGPIVPMRPKHRITENRVAYVMRKANRIVGVRQLTPHRLRGTYATWLAELGVPIQDIQRALGHKDSRTTLRYLEVGLGRIELAQVSIGDRLGMGARKIPAEAQAEPHPGKTSDFYRRIQKRGSK